MFVYGGTIRVEKEFEGQNRSGIWPSGATKSHARKIWTTGAADHAEGGRQAEPRVPQEEYTKNTK